MMRETSHLVEVHSELVRFPLDEPLNVFHPLVLVAFVHLSRPEPEAKKDRSRELVFRQEVQDLLGVI